MKTRPINNKIIVKKIDAEKITPGGLHIPQNVDENIMRGKIIHAPERCLTKDNATFDPGFRVGDVIIFAKQYQEVKIDDHKYLVMDYSNVMCVLEE